MNLIHSKDIFYIIRDIIKCIDNRVINHGIRTSYILYKMLEPKAGDKYEMYEIAEFCMLATFHDIGAFKTDYMEDMLKYENKDFMPHSIYGYLFLLYLTPFKDRAKILLYHHTDYSQVPCKDYEFKDIIDYLNVAEKMDMYSNTLGSKFDYTMFQKQADVKFSKSALETLYMVQKKEDIFGKLSTGEYKQELSELYDYLIFNNQEKHDYIRGFLYCVGFRSEYTMYDMLTCVNICDQLAEKLMICKAEREILYYAALFHDAGMCSVPREIIEAPRRLTDEEMMTMRSHVETLESILRGRVDQEVLDVICAHHERCDGSGYPNHLKDYQMNTLQKILQVADTITALVRPMSYREPKTRDEILAILREEADKGKLNREVVTTAINLYDPIMENVNRKTNETLATYRKLQENYKVTYEQIKK